MIRALGCLAVVAVLAVCSQGTPDLAALQREPAVGLRMADVTELGHFSGDKATTFEGAQQAHDDRVFGTAATDDAVRVFYDRELQRLGWQSDRLATSIDSVELAAWGWCKGAMVFRIGIQDQARAFKPEFYKGQSFRTVFDAGMMGRDPAVGCPAQIRR